MTVSQAKYNFVKKTTNRKMKGLPLVQSPRSTCWNGCPFLSICYAEQYPLGLIWNLVEQRGETLAVTCSHIAALKPNSLWRWGDVGDLPGVGGRIAQRAVEQLTAANRGKKGWAYTHKPVLGVSPAAERNRAIIKQANMEGFTINLSAEGWGKADALADLNIGPVFTVLPHNWMGSHQWKRSETPAGREIRQCPAERWDHVVTCATCGGKKGPWCTQANRDFIVGVLTHGCNKKQIAGIVAEMEMYHAHAPQ